jgi:hypothetical protein
MSERGKRQQHDAMRLAEREQAPRSNPLLQRKDCKEKARRGTHSTPFPVFSLVQLWSNRSLSFLRLVRNSSARLISRNLQNPPVHAGAAYVGECKSP